MSCPVSLGIVSPRPSNGPIWCCDDNTMVWMILLERLVRFDSKVLNCPSKLSETWLTRKRWAKSILTSHVDKPLTTTTRTATMTFR